MLIYQCGIFTLLYRAVLVKEAGKSIAMQIAYDF